MNNYSKKNFKNYKLVNDFSGFTTSHRATLTWREFTVILKKQNLAVLRMTQKPEIVGFYHHCYPALIPERGVSAAGFSDQIRIGVFTKL